MQITEETVLSAIRSGADNVYLVNSHIGAGSFDDNWPALRDVLGDLEEPAGWSFTTDEVEVSTRVPESKPFPDRPLWSPVLASRVLVSAAAVQYG